MIPGTVHECTITYNIILIDIVGTKNVSRELKKISDGYHTCRHTKGSVYMFKI